MMKRIVILLSLLGTFNTQADQTDDFDYFTANRTMIRNGVQAVLMCNGLFTSERTLGQVFRQELAYLSDPVGSIDGARRRAVIREPGTYWDYENYDTLLAVYAMKQALGDPETYATFPHTIWSSCGAVSILASRGLTVGI